MKLACALEYEHIECCVPSYPSLQNMYLCDLKKIVFRSVGFLAVFDLYWLSQILSNPYAGVVINMDIYGPDRRCDMHLSLQF